MATAIQLQNTRDVATLHGVKVLVYGGAGVGKTRLVPTAPAPLLISAESGLLSLREYDVPVIQVNDLPHLWEIYWWVARSQEAQQFWTICLDSVSEIAEKVLAAEKQRAKDPRQAFGALIDQTMLLLKCFRDLPNRHVYFSAKMEHFRDDTTGVVRLQPSMPGKVLGPALPYLFDEVFHMGVSTDQQGQKYRYLRTSPDHQYDAKDRSGSLAPFEPPDLTTIFNKILGVAQ